MVGNLDYLFGMKHLTQKFLYPLAVVLLFTISCASVQHGHDENGHTVPPDTSSAELNRMKELAGTWTSTTSMFGKKDEQVFTEYSVTAGGSAVLEKIFPGTPNEMVSLYYDDDQGKLAMTHYCMMRNRPYFTLVSSSNDEFKFDVTKIEGQKSKDTPSMGAITLKFEGKDHYVTSCESGDKTEENHEPMAMRYTRVKK
jgi:hypothetical protein